MSAALDIYKAIDFLIRVESGPDAGKLYKITPPQIDIGRDSALQITVNDPKASRIQCTILFGKNVTLKDQSSRKTTLVNGQSITQCNLAPNDIIEFGSSKLRFIARSKQQNSQLATARPGAPSKKAETIDDKQQRRKPFYLFVAVILGLIGVLLLLPEDSIQKEEKLTTTEELTQQVQASKDHQEELREAFNTKTKSRKRSYLFRVEQHYIRGFRDFMTGKYGRAKQAFGTVRATDKDHVKAIRYGRLAQKKQQDLIDAHLRDGLKYKDKLMYDRCASDFKKALILMSKPSHPKYKLAKSHMDECRLLKTGGY